MAPVKGPSAASLKSIVVRVMIVTVVMVIVTVVMEIVLMMLNVCLRTWDRADRKCSSGKGGQNESKFSHEHHSLR